MRDVEYDRFGPWILEIDDTDRVPPVFREHLSTDEEPLFRLKIPRPLDRRDLSPGEHMYDYLVSLFDDRIEILARDGNDAVRFRLEYADIVALKHSEELLEGHLVMYAPEVAYDLPYSTVSVDLIRRVLETIRNRYVPDHLPEQPEFSDDELPGDNIDPDGLSFLFSGLTEARRKSRLGGRLFALQVEKKMSKVGGGFLRRLFFGAVDKRLLESLHYLGDRELEIVNRGRSWAYRWQAVYGKETLYIPLDRLRGADEDSDGDSMGVSTLRLMTEASDHGYVFLEDNPAMERYRRIVIG